MREVLWESHTLGTHFPLALLNAVFYYNTLHFVLRGGQEHCNLKIYLLTFKKDPNPHDLSSLIEMVEYREFGSKNRPGGRHQLNLQNKVITHYAHPHLKECCHVYLLKFYLSRLPKAAHDKDIFYWKEHPDAGDPWYKKIPLGHNIFAKKLK